MGNRHHIISYAVNGCMERGFFGGFQILFALQEIALDVDLDDDIRSDVSQGDTAGRDQHALRPGNSDAEISASRCDQSPVIGEA